MQVFLTGGTGFVGRHILKKLLADGHSVRLLRRCAIDQSLTTVLSPFEPHDWKARLRNVPGDVVTTGTLLDYGMEGCDAVIHLVGIIAEKGTNTFDAVHHLGTRNVVEAAKRAGIRRFVHMSALGARPDGVAGYQTSKWKGEEAVRGSGIPFCILRPSLIFGPDGGFVEQMKGAMRQAPFFRPVPGDGKPKFRPIAVEDIANCFVKALSLQSATNQTIDLGGTDELSLNEILSEIARRQGVRKPAVHIPMPVMFLGAAIAQGFLPNPPVTVGQLRMLREGSTCDITVMKRVFGIEPRRFLAA
jgi:NADH dehydrogenase